MDGHIHAVGFARTEDLFPRSGCLEAIGRPHLAELGSQRIFVGLQVIHQFFGHRSGKGPIGRLGPVARVAQHAHFVLHLLHPQRRVARKAVFPTAEPQEHQFQVVAPGLPDEAIHQRKIEVAFFGLDLGPRHCRQHAVQIARYQLGPDRLHVFQTAGGVVAQFSGESQERFAVDDQLRRGSLFLQMRDARGGLRVCLDRDRTGAARQCATRKSRQFHACLLPRRAATTGTSSERRYPNPPWSTGRRS